MTNKALILLGFFAAQRFALSDFFHFAPIFPLLGAIFWISKSPKQSAVYVMLALFFTNDLGGEIYNTTYAGIRDATYIASIFILPFLISTRIVNSAVLQLVMLMTLVLFTTILYSIDGRNLHDSSTVIRDLLILICLCTCLTKGKSGHLDLTPLYYGITGYLLGESVNLFLFFDRATHAYMSYASLKSFIIFPVFYRLHLDKKFTPITIFLMLQSLLVVLAYNSKMFMLSLSMAVLIVSIMILYKKPVWIGRVVVSLFVLFLIYQTTVQLFPDSDGNRILAFSSALGSGQNIWATIEHMEATRVHQHYLFFSRGLFEIIFGNGIGAGLVDNGGLLMLVADESAFTFKEMQSGRYFNFHDIWIDFGLRFGLISVAIICYHLGKTLMSTQKRAMGVVFFIILINATFSISGIFLAVLFYKLIIQNIEDSDEVITHKL